MTVRFGPGARAYSKTALRFHGMEEVGVQFPVGPHNLIFYYYRAKIAAATDSLGETEWGNRLWEFVLHGRRWMRS